MKKLQLILILFIAMAAKAQVKPLPALKVSSNGRYFQTADGKPFFWLGDTGWLLFNKLKREETIQYLEARRQQGFNVIQVMVIHDLKNAVNRYGDSALVNQNIAAPVNTAGNRFKIPDEYDFWDHVDFVVDEAAKRGLYMAMVPVWGGNIKDGGATRLQARTYAVFLAQRYRNKSNIVWLNGGDIKGSDSLEVWQTLGTALRENDRNHLITFHPRGRNSSSDWFHNEHWMDFNMFQSGHRTYAQDTSSNEKLHFGEDNWKYVDRDYQLQPSKPTFDGEPSYENIPHGLHDPAQPRWKDADLRRYAYWSVFAGGAGFTYGENSVMQFHTLGDKDANFGVDKNWKERMQSPGANQMKHLKKLLLSQSYFDRVPAQDILVHNTGDKYNYLLATRSRSHAWVYTYTGKEVKVDFSKLGFRVSKARWFNPSNGQWMPIKLNKTAGIVSFNPPGKEEEGNDWVLELK